MDNGYIFQMKRLEKFCFIYIKYFADISTQSFNTIIFLIPYNNIGKTLLSNNLKEIELGYRSY